MTAVLCVLCLTQRSTSAYAFDSCRAIFFSTDRSALVRNLKLSDPRKIDLVEMEIGRKLEPREISILLDVIHLKLDSAVPVLSDQNHDAEFQIKKFLLRDILRPNSFIDLFERGILSSAPEQSSREHVEQVIRYGESLGLSAKETHLVNRYSADLYFDMNRRQTDPILFDQLLRSVLKLPRFQGTVYRGVEAKWIHGLSVGDIVKVNDFWSASILRDVADSWREGGVTLIIETSAGRILGPLARYSSESEVLIPPGAKFKIDRIDAGQIFLSEHD